MLEIRYMQLEDKEFWYSLDKHLPESEYERKVRDKMGYVFDKKNLISKNPTFLTYLVGSWIFCIIPKTAKINNIRENINGLIADNVI